MTDICAKVGKFFSDEVDVLLVIVFGSQADGRASENSDLDVAIAGHASFSLERLVDLQLELGSRLAVEIDLVDLNAAHGAVLQEALSKGRVVTRRDAALYAKLLKRMYYEREDDGRFVALTVTTRLRNATGK